MSVKKEGMSRRDLLFGVSNRLKEFRERVVPEGAFRTNTSSEDSSANGKPTAEKNLEQQAGAAMASGEYSEALSLYRAHLKQNTRDFKARTMLGYCFYRLERYTQCVVELSRVQRKGPNNTAALYLGLSHARLDKLEKAASAWEQYANPHETMIWRELNFQRALIDSPEPPAAEEIWQAVENALEERRKELLEGQKKDRKSS